MAILIDTGVLLRSFHREDPMYVEIRSSFRALRAHGDGLYVSVMLAEGIPRILTLNVRDFQRYPEIEAVTPTMLASEL